MASSTFCGWISALLTRFQCFFTLPSGPIQTVERMTPTQPMPGGMRLAQQKRDQRMHEHGRFEHPGVLNQNIRQDIGAIRKADADDGPGLMPFAIGGDELAHAMGCTREILAVVDAFRLAPEEPRRAVLGDVAARRNHRGIRQQTAAEVEELVLVTTGPVKDEEDRRPGFARLGANGRRTTMATAVTLTKMTAA